MPPPIFNSNYGESVASGGRDFLHEHWGLTLKIVLPVIISVVLCALLLLVLVVKFCCNCKSSASTKAHEEQTSGARSKAKEATASPAAGRVTQLCGNAVYGNETKDAGKAVVSIALNIESVPACSDDPYCNSTAALLMGKNKENTESHESEIHDCSATVDGVESSTRLGIGRKILTAFRGRVIEEDRRPIMDVSCCQACAG